MFTLLSRIFIKERKGESSADVRRAYGMLSGVLGICLNILLFAGKYLAGTLTCSIAITADAFNNLSDAGSSLVTFLGFRLSGKKADEEHPFGHGRIEYISAFIVAILIILMGFELAKTSVEKILSPGEVELNVISIVILALSILVKLYMYFYNKSFGKRLGSEAMIATATDSLSDAISTSVVLAASVVMHYTAVHIDGWCGAVVAALILYAGYTTARDTIGALLGRAPSPELVKQIEDIVLASKYVSGIHDLVVNDYGPGRLLISLHAEVPATGNIMVLHDDIDNLERKLKYELGCEAVIHMDPIETQNEEINELRDKIAYFAAQVDPRITVHDFRMVKGPTHRNMIFDVLVPYDVKLKTSEVKAEISRLAKQEWNDCFCVMTFDRPYT